MKVNIYYGGRGMVDDPTIFVMGKIQEVLEELNVNVTRYNLYEMKNTITTLSQTVTEADAVVLATTVEWLGMGGYMQSFLDSCWLYGDKDQIGKVYMFPVVMAKTYGEREVSLALANSWEIIGGRYQRSELLLIAARMRAVGHDDGELAVIYAARGMQVLDQMRNDKILPHPEPGHIAHHERNARSCRNLLA